MAFGLSGDSWPHHQSDTAPTTPLPLSFLSGMESLLTTSKTHSPPLHYLPSPTHFPSPFSLEWNLLLYNDPLSSPAGLFHFPLLSVSPDWTDVPDSSERLKTGSLKINTALEYSTRVVQEGGRRCKKSTLNDLVHLTPLRIPLMNPPLSTYTTHMYRTVHL
jgi:hypothetical protein